MSGSAEGRAVGVCVLWAPPSWAFFLLVAVSESHFLPILEKTEAELRRIMVFSEEWV